MSVKTFSVKMPA